MTRQEEQGPVHWGLSVNSIWLRWHDKGYAVCSRCRQSGWGFWLIKWMCKNRQWRWWRDPLTRSVGPGRSFSNSSSVSQHHNQHDTRLRQNAISSFLTHMLSSSSFRCATFDLSGRPCQLPLAYDSRQLCISSITMIVHCCNYYVQISNMSNIMLNIHRLVIYSWLIWIILTFRKSMAGQRISDRVDLALCDQWSGDDLIF